MVDGTGQRNTSIMDRRAILRGGAAAAGLAFARFFVGCGDEPSIHSTSCVPQCTGKVSAIGKITSGTSVDLGDGFTGTFTRFTTTSAGIGFTLYVSDPCNTLSKSVNLLATTTPSSTSVNLTDTAGVVKATVSLVFIAKEEKTDAAAARSSLGLYLASSSVSCPSVFDGGNAADQSARDGGIPDKSVDNSASDFKSEGNDAGTTDGKTLDITSSKDSKVKPPLDVGIQFSDTTVALDKSKPADQTKTPDQTNPDQSLSVCNKCVPTNSGGITLPDINYGATVSDVPVTNGVKITYTAGSPTNLSMGVSIKLDTTCLGKISVSSTGVTLGMNATPFDSANTQSVTVKDLATGKITTIDFSATITGKGMQLTYRVKC